ncbi:FAD-dependent oxidoreductase [Sphingomonas sp. TX0543]|uniref:FAD-dependent oxidoreductase n=1 Tax=Sphingomonas sp. TX0543 TaxID=3399682 RepID=UPI003AFB53A3
MICGAGASGLTLAIDLARRNVAFRIVEKLPTPFAGSRGKGIQPRTQEVFEDLGVVDRLFSTGGIYPPQREYLADGSHQDSPIMEGSSPTAAEPFGLPLMVPQFLTERILRDRLAEFGHHVEFGCELTAFRNVGECLSIDLATEAGEETIRARYLVGADGGRSPIRKELGIDFPGKTLGVRAVVADVALSGLDRDFWHRFGEGDMQRQISLCPLAGTDLFQIQAPVPLEGEVGIAVPDLNAMIVDRTGRTDIVVDTVSWASAFTMSARLADRYCEGRVFLVGDAAHVHPPTGGQGLNTSVQDAYNLGWKLGAVLSGAPHALLDSYGLERRSIAAGMLGLSTGLLDQMKEGTLRRGRDVHQLDLSYRGSPLSMPGPAADRLRQGGDRAPDARLLGRSGRSRRLFDLLTGPHWTLLKYMSDDRVAARPWLAIYGIGPHADFDDVHRDFVEAYSVEQGDRILIRPDGYIAAVVARDQTRILEDYLRGVGIV